MESILDPNKTPALQPPLGVVPNFVDPPTILGPFLAGEAVMLAASTLAVSARVFTKAYVMKKVDLEDYFLVLSWALYIVFRGFTLAQCPFSLGRHQWDVSLAQMEQFLWLENYAEFFYCFMLLFVKLAILLQIQRIFRGTSKNSIYWLSSVMMILDTLFYTATSIVALAQCNPREKIWNPLLPGTCVNNDVDIMLSGAFNLGLDILILVLPVYAIFRLKIAIKRKLGISAVFATGILTCIASILRLYYSIGFITAADATYYPSINVSWTAGLEGTCATLVACFPVMPRLLQFIRGEQPAGFSARPSSYRAASSSTKNLRNIHRGHPGVHSYSNIITPTNRVEENETKSSDDWLPLEKRNENKIMGTQIGTQISIHATSI